jgi:hypothetical protein
MLGLVGMVGLTGVLASCDVTITPGNQSGLVVYADSLTLTSDYTISNQAFNGSSYSGPVICDDRRTNLQFNFDYLGDLQSVSVNLRGVTTQEPKPLQVTNYNLSAGRGIVNFYASSGSVPLSIPSKINTQAIIVSPKIIGSTYIEMIADSSTGSTRTLTSNALPVLASCG